MLIHRWGVLRKALPINISIAKTASLVRALCMLHNFCIDNNESVAIGASDSDTLFGLSAGRFSHNVATTRPAQLTDGGDHFDGIPRADRRVHERRTGDLPREKCVKHLEAMGVQRWPAPRGSTTTNLN